MKRLKEEERKKRFARKSPLQMQRLVDLIHTVEDQLRTVIQNTSKIRGGKKASITTQPVPAVENTVTELTAFEDSLRDNRVGERKD